MHSILSTSLWSPRYLRPYAWFRADLGISLVGPSGSEKVAAWGDQSGNGNHLTQGSDPLRPAYDAAVAARGNCPAVRTNGTTYMTGAMTLPREVSWVIAFGSVSSGYALAHSNGAVEYHYIFSGGPATHYVRNTAGTIFYRTVSSQPAFVANTNTIVTYNGSAITMRRSGVLVSMSTDVGNTPAPESIASTLYVGRGGAGGGSSLQILELIVAPPLSAQQISYLNSYFARMKRPN